MQFELTPGAHPANYGESIVSLEDMKAHLAFTDGENEFNALIAAYRDAAVDMVERYCGVYLAPRAGVVWRGEGLPARVNLGVRPVTAISSVAWLDDDGEDVSGDASDWRVMGQDTIVLKPARFLPSRIAAGVEITFDAGYAPGACPPALLQAVKLFAAHLFLHREAVITGTISGEIPLGFRQLCDLYRFPRI